MRAAKSQRKLLKSLGFGAAAALLALAPTAASAGKFKVLHTFCSKAGCYDGYLPEAPLVRDAAGNFFGTTSRGGKKGPGEGTAYELKNVGDGKYSFKTIYQFDTPPNFGAMIVDTAGNLYGFDDHGGFYELSPPSGDIHRWLQTQLGGVANATSGLTYAGASSGSPWDGSSPLYGVAVGGQNGGGFVFSLVPNGGQWEESVLYAFCSQQNCVDGDGPVGGLLLGSSGQLYGTTAGGGANKGGVAFELSGAGDQWTETVLYNFCSLKNCSDGFIPRSKLVADTNGNLFGTTLVGGRKCSLNNGGCGVVFKLAPEGESYQESVVYSFCKKANCADGANRETAPLIDPQGNLVGTTDYGGKSDPSGQGAGVIYEIAGASYKTLYRFCAVANCADGEYPTTNLALDADGSVLGTTLYSNDTEEGTVFRLQR